MSQQELEDRRIAPRRQEDNITTYRLGKLEEIVDRLVKNQEVLTRIEIQGSESSRTLRAVEDRLDRQGKALDVFAREVEHYKTQLAQQPTPTEFAAMKARIDSLPDATEIADMQHTLEGHRWSLRLVLGAILVFLANTLMNLIAK